MLIAAMSRRPFGTLHVVDEHSTAQAMRASPLTSARITVCDALAR
jgi:Arc/MetJ family transcription regulator